MSMIMDIGKVYMLVTPDAYDFTVGSTITTTYSAY